MRVLVCGGRDYQDKDKVFAVLDEIHAQTSISSIIHGCASGADTLGSDWAWIRGIDEERYPADWKTHGKAAGPIRNRQMLNTQPNLVVAFPGGRGTQDMINISRIAGIEVREIL
jgi:hypothetical protein